MQFDCAGVIVAGGYGKRLAPITNVLPKVLVPVGDRAMLDVLVGQLAGLGITRTHLLLGHQADLVRAYADGRPQLTEQMRLCFHTDTGDLGTAGPLSRIRTGPGTLLVMNGDVLTTADLRELIHRHHDEGNDFTVATTDYPVTVPYGVLHSDDRSRLVTVDEKPSLEFRVSAGIYVLGSRARAQVPGEGPDDMPDLIRRCMKAGLKVGTHRLLGGAWFDLGTEDGYRRCLQYGATPAGPTTAPPAGPSAPPARHSREQVRP
ncbi:sugar phosphate nucleotidyltransferase [Streptomyces sp. MST-110588]|uniref:sugar phosphate nucleotidyltransferase n=1 Tax=Streptomyces sp. MST-110588 TaxID=2833628 RepID=UPI002050BDE8|nr:sugar phosphate nucleotidyltransferase [Streptomyces sp. MST-110588]UNO39353.1 NTP transferase domain-containing protein [Streptomyces sp. MST-110588]